MTPYPVPEPRQDPGVEEYWDSAATRELKIAHCGHCRRCFWYPRPRCPACMSTAVDFVAVRGDGIVYSFTVNRRPAGPYKALAAVVLAYVELTEGLRILTNIIDASPDDVRIGMPVRAVFERSPDRAGVLRFEPRP